MTSNRSQHDLLGLGVFVPEFQGPQRRTPAASYDLPDPSSSALQQQPYQPWGSPINPLKSNNPYRNSPQISNRSADSCSLRSPSLPELVDWPDALLERRQSLRDYFSIGEERTISYTDQELADIARLLRENGCETWSQVPRIYTILRLIGQLPAIDSFIEQGLDDLWLPFSISQLPNKMPAFHRERFLEFQNMVLTKAMSLENSTVKKHIHFRKGEKFPLTIGEKLGHGGYGCVYKAYSPISGRTYALKTFRRTKTFHRDSESFRTELQVLKRINHHHCVELVASYTDARNFGLLISPVADFNLSEYYGHVLCDEEKKKTLRTFFGCLAHALEFLHKSKIRHRDVKPENILVRGSEVYLADFGISLDWENLTRSTTTADSAKSWTYCAPELTVDGNKRNSSSDIWSLGCVFLEMLTILKGFAVDDLRDEFRNHSGRPRFYENSDVAMDWAERLSRYGLASEREVVKWVRAMIIKHPSSRITAHGLSVSIVNYGNKSREKEGFNAFCGECCSPDYEIESCRETASDSDDWARDFDNDIATPTSSLMTAHSRQSDESSIRQHGIHQERPSASPIPGAFRSLRLSESEEDKSSIDQDNHDERSQNTTSPHASQCSNNGPTRPSHREQKSNCDILDINPATLSSPLEQVTVIPAIIQLQRKDSVFNEHGLLERKAENRLEAIKEVIIKHKEWPFTDIRGRLPIFSASSWLTPMAFLRTVQSDILYMEYLRSTDPSQFNRFKAAGLEDLIPMIHLLLKNGLDVNKRLPKGDTRFKKATPLFLALQDNWNKSQWHVDVAKLLIGFGAELNFWDKNSDQSPLSRVCWHGNSETIRVLLELDPSVTTRTDFGGNTPIYIAARRGHHLIVDMLAKSGANFRAVMSGGLTPGTAAAANGHIKVLEVLVQNGMGADEGKSFLNADWRPLHYAAERGHTEVVKYLISKGADPMRKGFGEYVRGNGRTPLRLAQKGGHTETAKVIEGAIAERK